MRRSAHVFIKIICENSLRKTLARKARTLRDHEQKLARARSYIVQHLDEDIDTRRLAAEASMSLFHFHRVYLGFYGERPAETVRRMRLERASEQLRDMKTGLHEIGRLAGYASTPAFTRAFKRFSGLSPGAFRDRHATATSDESSGAQVFTPLQVSLLNESPVRLALFNQPAQIDALLDDLDQVLEERLPDVQPPCVFLIPATGICDIASVYIGVPADQLASADGLDTVVDLDGGTVLAIARHDKVESQMQLFKTLLEQLARIGAAPAPDRQLIALNGYLRRAPASSASGKRWSLEVVLSVGSRAIMPRPVNRL